MALVGMFSSFTHHYLKICFRIGSSGSGKSTTIQLIERFYDPNIGQVVKKTSSSFPFSFLFLFSILVS